MIRTSYFLYVYGHLSSLPLVRSEIRLRVVSAACLCVMCVGWVALTNLVRTSEFCEVNETDD